MVQYYWFIGERYKINVGNINDSKSNIDGVIQSTTRATNKITFAPDFQKSIPMFNGLATRCQVLDWLNTINRDANLNR